MYPCLLSLLALCACASHPPAPGPVQPAAAAPATGVPTRAHAQLVQVLQLARQESFAKADRELTALLASADFPGLSAAERHQALSLGSMLALQAHDAKRAQSLARRACEMHEAQSYDWLLRVEAGIVAADAADTLLASKVVAERWPELLPQSLQGLEDAPDPFRYEVLSGLSNFSMTHEPAGASLWWRDLALLQLGRGEHAAAVTTLSRIANAYVAVSIEADRRFDAVRGHGGGRLSVEQTAQRAIEAAAARAQSNPDKLEPLNELARRLGESLQLPQVLQVADSAIEQVIRWGESAYSDYDPQYSQLLAERAQVLAATGRWEAALIQLQAASRLPENGADNVSQVIDLAALYNDLGRAQDARTTLAKFKTENASSIGVMQFQKEKLRAALGLGDSREAELTLKYMDEHREEALDAYQQALLAADRPDAGAQLLIRRLGNPRTRSAALLAVQDYSEVTLTPVQLENQRRWQALVGRPDVTEAIARVGRVGQYHLAGDSYY
jgi:tetratricopeptide (TPR) repeat protein